MEIINWKENKEVGTIYFEVRIPMEKPKNFQRKFSKKNIVFGFNNFILEENKNIFGDIFIPSKGQWAIGLIYFYKHISCNIFEELTV